MSQKPRQKISVSGSGVNDPNFLLASFATSDSVVTTKTTFLNDGTAPDDGGSIVSITPGGTTADVAAGDITVVGTVREFKGPESTDFEDVVTTELVAIAENASAAVFTARPFKTVTSVTIPIQDGTAATYEVGIAKDVAAVFRINSTRSQGNELWGVSLAMAVLPTTSENFTVTLDATAGAAYDHLVSSLDLDTLDVASVFREFDSGIFLDPGDKLFAHFPNTEAKAWGLQITLGV